MDIDSSKSRKRKREEDPTETETNGTNSSLLSSPFQAIKNFFLGPTNTSESSEIMNEEKQDSLSPPAKRRKLIAAPDFITSSPKSPKMVKPLTAASFASPAKSQARRSLGPVLASEPLKNSPKKSATQPSVLVTPPPTEEQTTSLARASTEPPKPSSSSSTLLNLFSPMLNMFGGRRSDVDIADDQGDDDDVLEAEESLDNDEMIVDSHASQSSTPRRSSRLARGVGVSTPKGTPTRSRITKTTTTTTATTTTVARRDSPSRKAKTAANRQLVSPKSRRTRVIRTTVTKSKEEPSLSTTELAEKALASPVRPRRVRAVRSSTKTSTLTKTTTFAVVEDPSISTEPQNASHSSALALELTSNETLDGPSTAAAAAPASSKHVTVRQHTHAHVTLSTSAGDDSASPLNDSTIDIDAVYDEVLEDELKDIESTDPDRQDEANSEYATRVIEIQELEDSQEEEEEEFDSFVFIASLPPRNELPALPLSPVLPPKHHNDRKMTLILDLDETLVHCSLEPIDDPDLTFMVPFQGNSFQVYVRKRPHFEEFLEKVATLFDVAIFTASQQVYADRLLNILDPHRKWSKHRLFRDSCLNVVDNYLKDLTILGRDLARVAIVDNSPHVFGYQLDNGIPIESWFDDRSDKELLRLLPFLETLQHASDVRPLIRDKFKLYARVEDSRNVLIQQQENRERKRKQRLLLQQQRRRASEGASD